MDEHEQLMRRALELAERGWGRVSPNPMVGALVVADDGSVLGEGWHEGPGTRHAEAMALEMAGDAARGATVITSLEPCNRVGRTPPCTRALLGAGIRRVVIGATDPNLGEGAPGIAELRAGGVEVTSGVLEADARRLNEAFEHHVRTGRPVVVMKSAATLDGKTAAVDGSSRWITSEDARGDVQRLRAWSDAILVGSRTVAEDDPALTVRDPRYADARPPLRVAVDSSGRLPPVGRLFDGAAPTLIATTDRTTDLRIAEWRTAGADVVVLDRDEDDGVSLRSLLALLGEREVQGVLVEAGANLAWALLREDLVDRIVLYVAPKVLGGASAPGVVDGRGFAPVGEALELAFERVERIGPDLKVEARVHRDR
ncbi:MAG TPA: bifunctional diaminohydroxyphosphoribosylaminopyrimidine deaminase/5-amino-6-(5-phosphoribosylamino)uracil reductase RibD [Actinomycetota bacterium]|nr:bifunctional diaminohydroxyphosphoribosylaminopyrimidine deaminase/5-amino-6-(5-phosphoribosylamino)uracil reductase RibD [Actinomycetota bacterium]